MLLTTCMQIASANFINIMIERVLILSLCVGFTSLFFTIDQSCYAQVYETEHRNSK